MIGAAAPRPAGLHARLRGIRPFAQRMDQPVARKRPLRGKRHVIGSLGQIEHARVYAAVRQPPRRKDNHTPTAAETGVLRLGVDAACAARAEHKALLRGQRADAPGKAPGAFIWLPRADDADARQLQQRRLTPQEEHQRRTIPQQRAKRRRIARRDACEREDAPPLRRGEIGMERCLPREQIFDALRLLRRITQTGQILRRQVAPQICSAGSEGARPLRQCAELRIAQRAAGFIAQGAAQQQHPLLRRSQRRNRRREAGACGFFRSASTSVPSSRKRTGCT